MPTRSANVYANVRGGVSARADGSSLCALADQKTQEVFEEALQYTWRLSKGFAWWRWAVTDGEVLFPYSDLDMLFLFGNEKTEQTLRPLISDFSRTLWDMGFRVSSAGQNA